jgi:hypothetical protein
MLGECAVRFLMLAFGIATDFPLQEVATRMMPSVPLSATTTIPALSYLQMLSEQTAVGEQNGPGDWMTWATAPQSAMSRNSTTANGTRSSNSNSTHSQYFSVPNRCGGTMMVERDWKERNSPNHTANIDGNHAIVATNTARSYLNESIDLRSCNLSQVTRLGAATVPAATSLMAVAAVTPLQQLLVGQPTMRDCSILATTTTTTLPTPPTTASNWSVLPCCLASSPQSDALVLSPFQIFLRRHIEVFAADRHDVYSPVRGRTKAVHLYQVGIRCRHCAHVAPSQRAKGAAYFPQSTLGLYQAAQNMSSTHLQTGACPEMPESIQQSFTDLLSTKRPGSSSMSGRKYWSDQAQKMGLVDTEQGIFSRLHL